MKRLLSLALLGLLLIAGLLSNISASAHDGSDEKQQTAGIIQMRMDGVQKMMLSNLGKPDPDYDMRYMALLLGQEKAALKLSQEAGKSALNPEIKQLALQQAAEHAARVEQLEVKMRLWFNQ